MIGRILTVVPVLVAAIVAYYIIANIGVVLVP